MVTTPTAPLDTADSAIKPSTECASDTQLLKKYREKVTTITGTMVNVSYEEQKMSH